MNASLERFFPYLLILLGMLLLFFVEQPLAAGVCFQFGIVMIILRIWPEKWDAEENI